MDEQQKTVRTAIVVRTDLYSGYWTCTGVKGAHDWQGYYYNNPTAAVCYKPKYAPLFGAPASPGGDD